MQEHSEPFVSVIMGVRYRSADTIMLQRSIKSILAQSIGDFELIICAIGSSEEAWLYLTEKAAQDRRIHLVNDEDETTDLANKLNVCLRYARGRFIARMDDDDFSHPKRLESQLCFLRDNPGIAFVGCNVNIYNDGMRRGRRIFPEHPKIEDFFFSQPFIHPTLMFRRDVLRQVGGYSEDKRCVLCEDYDLLLRIYAAGERGANIQEFLFDYSISDDAAKGNRRMQHRWNETVTRWRRFKELKVFPKAFPYVAKPLVVGLIPRALLRRLKQWRKEN